MSCSIDDAYLGGELSGGTAGRGSQNKAPFVAAVSLNAQGHPQYVKLTPVAGFTREAIGQWSATHLQPGRPSSHTPFAMGASSRIKRRAPAS
jgi:hypothetical protein